MNREGEAGRGPLPREAAPGGPRVLPPVAQLVSGCRCPGTWGALSRRSRFRDLFSLKYIFAGYLREVIYSRWHTLYEVFMFWKWGRCYGGPCEIFCLLILCALIIKPFFGSMYTVL